MTSNPLAVGAAALAVIAAATAAPLPSLAQGAASSMTRVEQVSAKVTVQSVDMATRHVVVKNEAGETLNLKVPEEARNAENLKPGDVINAHYYRETELVLAKPNATLPEDTAAVVSARSAKGELPAGVIANRLVVTGAIVGIDRSHNTVKLVSPKGGEVHDILVTSEEGRKALGQLKVGDTITVYVTEGLLISTDRG